MSPRTLSCFGLVFILFGGHTSQAGDWPSRSQQTVFQFQTAFDEMVAYGESSQEPIFNYALEAEGFARIDSSGRLVLGHGRFKAPGQDRVLAKQLKTTGEFGLQVFLAPPAEQPSSEAVILALGDNFQLSQKGKHLQFRLNKGGGSYGTLSGPLPKDPDQTGQGCHVAVSLKAGQLSMFINGRATPTMGGLSRGTVPWDEGPLSLGSGAPDKPGWDGRLEGLVLSTEGFSAESVGADYRAYGEMVAVRKPPTTLHLKGKLTAKSQVVSLEDLSPYSESLSVFEYSIVNVSKGFYLLNKVRVAHWVVLGNRHLPIAQLEPGQTVDMVLEPFSANPQLKNVHFSDTLDIDFDLDLYFATGLH